MAFNIEAYRFPGSATRLQAYAWPGGDPLFYLCADGGILCPACASEDGQVDNPHDPQWHLVGVDVNWEDDSLQCDHCQCAIESAYGAPEFNGYQE
jgi:hypothetical protein